ncbi:MAG: hypothetical protein OXI73_01860 [Rhodospirillales bacterium]|nr:hypothetical protein [Rhodospirillales bacterium]
MTADHPITVVTPIPTTHVPVAQWQPAVGPEARGVVERKRLPREAGEAVIEAAASILARGTHPTSPQDDRTGLVVGYVQSGKTLSFTTVIALARDNGYRLIVAIAGTSTSLLNQSIRRLRNDLYVDDVDGYLRWSTFTNPDDTEGNWRSIEQVLDEWRDPLVPQNERPTVLITVMKNHRHLANLFALLNRLNLSDVPTLIIDDEADQASLNTLVNRGRESTTYRRLLELRDTVPCHTFLQYTATPQAPLLINIIDALSPDFVEVLEPGEDYAGGRSFFSETRGLVSVIPYEDVPTDDNPLVDPPGSLLDALRVFLVGVASGLIQGRSRSNANRSMLVHPSRETVQHQEYRIWIGQVFDEWRRVLALPEKDPDRVDLLQDFQDARSNLVLTVPDLPYFDELKAMLPRAFRLTSIEEVNTRAGRGTPSIDWSRSYGWILVGGQAMDRGFTVEGLTVTYMPRGPGVGNADTIQQRGRFFGYKRPYLGYCRTYLEHDVLSAFEEYVEHEEEMRRQLQQVRASGSPLSDWKRAFVLSPALRPCRSNVIQYDYARGRYANAWFAPRTVLSAPSVINDNRRAVLSFLDDLTFSPNAGSPNREPAQMHHVCRDVPMVDIINDLLVPYRLTASRDTREITGVLLQLSHALEQNPDERCIIYRMSPAFARRRTVDANGRIRNLFQGAAPVSPPSLRGSTYPGDLAIHEHEEVTVQVHFVELSQDGMTVAENVPIVAIWIPRRMDLAWLTQEQP